MPLTRPGWKARASRSARRPSGERRFAVQVLRWPLRLAVRRPARLTHWRLCGLRRNRRQKRG